MFYYKVKILKAARFRRLTGVQKGTFAKMVEVLNLAEKEKHIKHGGRTSPLTMEDRLLMALMYWRENRTLAAAGYNFHLLLKWLEIFLRFFFLRLVWT